MPSLQNITGRDQALHRVRLVGRLLDEAIAIPGTPYRIGLDPIIGLLPISGDLLMTLFSAYIVLEATRFGVPKSTLARMILNLTIDCVVGMIPGLGDLFDFAWKANSRNVALLEAHVNNGTLQHRRDRRVILGVALLLLAIVLGFATIGIFLLIWLWHWLMS